MTEWMKPATNVLVDVSQALVDLGLTRDKECYRNSLGMLASLQKSGVRGLRYTEGFAISEHGLVCAHSWLQHYRMAAIIEPTPVWLKAEGKTAYFPARMWSMAEIRRRAKRPETMWLPFSEHDTRGNYRRWSPKYRHAYLSASFHAYGEKAMELLLRVGAA